MKPWVITVRPGLPHDVPTFIRDVFLLPQLAKIGEVRSRLTGLMPSYPCLKGILSFKRRVFMTVIVGTGAEGSFIVEYDGDLYRVRWSWGEARCHVCTMFGHLHGNCRNRRADASKPNAVPAPPR